MPFPVACGCGQRFMAEDWLAGRCVPCPACGTPLQIPGGVAFPSAPSYQRPLGLPARPARPSRSSTGQGASGDPGLTRWLIVAGSVAAAVVLFVVLAIVWHSVAPSSPQPTVADNRPAPPPTAVVETPGPQPAPVSGGLGGEAFRPAPPMLPPREPGSPTNELTSATGLDARPAPAAPNFNTNNRQTPNEFGTSGTTKPEPRAVVRKLPLDGGVARWYEQPNLQLVGTRAIPDEELVVLHYSWMCELLPFLGHEDLYQQFDFRTPWTKEGNLKAAGTVVPEFLNPADNRQKWTGAQLRGLALTHFVGMSGVEDRRSVVAAELPRSDPRAGVFGYREVARAKEITDGAAQTILLIGSGQIAAPWVQGGGATIRGAREPHFDPLTGFGSRGLARPGAVVLMADGSTRHLSAEMDPKVFRALCTTHGADSVDAAHLGPAVPAFPGVR